MMRCKILVVAGGLYLQDRKVLREKGTSKEAAKGWSKAGSSERSKGMQWKSEVKDTPIANPNGI